MGLQKIGALWKKTAKESGMKYLSGSIEVISGVKMFVKVMPYTVKEGTEKKANSPDFNILLQIEDKEGDKEVVEQDKDIV